MIKIFFVYFFLFMIFFFPGLKSKEKSGTVLKLIAMPAVLAIVVTFISVIKIFIIYKLLLLLFGFVTFLLTYWQWGTHLRRWWN